MHHKLCQHLLTKYTRKATFGLFLHALLQHAPLKYEVVTMLAICQYRKPGVNLSAGKTKAELQPLANYVGNVVPNLVFHVQAKQLTGQLSCLLKNGETRMKQVGAALLHFPGTTVSEIFISGCSSSWQAHLELVNHYVPAVWRKWKKGPWAVHITLCSDNGVGQRREDMMSCCGDNLHTLITFQGQESRMQVTRMALWTKSRCALSVFY